METEPTKYECGQILHDEEGVVSNCARTTYVLLSRDRWSRWDAGITGTRRMAWRCTAHRSLAKTGIPDQGVQIIELFEEDLDKLDSWGFVKIEKEPVETPEALQRQLTATANELIRAHARIRTLEAEVRRLKERLVEKTEKLIDRRRRRVNVKRNGKHDATRDNTEKL